MVEELISKEWRVCCLYRVSTLGQVEKNDIPMQKEACREFVQQYPGWKIVKEFSEKGISGFKISAKDRDAIQEIQRDALQNKFDILLVFMFDRLGRREDETPFVVEWFVKNGIEVWSAKEGQQRFDTHVDKLLNYIRYWQASGESIKTSVRTKTRMEQLTKEGCFTGGVVPFGYRLEHKGRTNKRNQDVGDLVIDPDEAEIVKLIFQKYLYEGYGAQRLCRYLAAQGIKIEKQQAKEVELIKSKLNLLNEQHHQKQREYQDLRSETIKVIQGTSRLNADLLNSLVDETTEQIKQLAQQIQSTTEKLEETLQSANQILREYDQLIGWAEMYDNCTFEAKKMIVAQFVKEVHVRRDYEIDIEFNVSFEEFEALYLDKEPEEIRGRKNDTILTMETKARQVV